MNWSGLCDVGNALQPVPTFSHYRYFAFSKPFESTSTETANYINCSVKINFFDEWMHFENKNTRNEFFGEGGFRFYPPLSNTPSTVICMPGNKMKVTKRL